MVACAALTNMATCPDIRSDQILLAIQSAQTADRTEILLAALQGLLRACELPEVGDRCQKYAVTVIK